MNRIIIMCILSTFFAGCTPNGQQENETPDIFLKPGDIVSESVIQTYGLDYFFSINDISDDIFSIIKGKSYKDNCTIPIEDLRYILCLHKDIEGVTKIGEMIVNKSIAEDVLDIFKKLYLNNYPIENMRLVDYYDAEDETSMRANNSSSFNFRFISNTTTISKHGEGMAVDINPLYNPYYKVLKNGTEDIEPATATPYLDRTKEFDYKITKGDLCYTLFIEHGFEWGGEWTSCKDYQHFEK